MHRRRLDRPLAARSQAALASCIDSIPRHAREIGAKLKRAFICGVCGQDGSLLARLLLQKGYQVWGSSRDAFAANQTNLLRLGIASQVKLISMNQADFRSVIGALTMAEPSEVYVLSGQTSVELSFEQPAEALQSITVGALNILESVRMVDRDIKVYFAGSSEVFGGLNGGAANEDAAFSPRSPYGVAKASAFWLVKNFRDSFGLFCVSGILFNHESPLRPGRFVTQKIITAAREIADGRKQLLTLGNLKVVRDWGWAAEYVDAIWRMIQLSTPTDLVIATGRASSLAEFTRSAFAHYGLDSDEWVRVDETLFRPSEIMWSQGDPERAAQVIDWRATFGVAEVVTGMADSLL